MVSFEIFVKSMLPSLSELKVTPSFCFAFKIPDNVTASSIYASRNVCVKDIDSLLCKLEVEEFEDQSQVDFNTGTITFIGKASFKYPHSGVYPYAP